jgi:uncharacterized protein (TIGR01777 family)
VKVVVSGATGSIGSALVKELVARGDEVIALSRDASAAREALGVEAAGWADPQSQPAPANALSGADAVVHLLGEPVAQRWSQSAKREIRNSRMLGTRNLVAALRELPEGERPGTLVSQSATGLYGPRGDEPVDESTEAGNDFLAEVTEAWEAEARGAEELGLRVVTTRTGVVLSASGGALEKMLPPFKLGVGGPVAGGRQYVPWVHMDDVVGAFAFALDTPAASGPLNVTAPEPVTNGELSKALGRVLHRPAFAPVPGLALRLLYGDMASIILGGVRAVPRRLLDLGYDFRRPGLEDALREATGRG